MDPKTTILRIAEVAQAIGWQAGVGGCETAGAIISYLAANPDRIETFLKAGLLDALDRPDGDPRDLHLDGSLTWHRLDGSVISPAEARAAKADRNPPLAATPPPPVDRSARTLTDGSPVTEDHRDLKDNGQQKGYVVLSDAERAKGFVRPVRDAYRHKTCGAITTMSRSIAETYARDPFFYSGTFCTTCRTHCPVGEEGEFTWYENDGTEGPKVGT